MLDPLSLILSATTLSALFPCRGSYPDAARIAGTSMGFHLRSCAWSHTSGREPPRSYPSHLLPLKHPRPSAPRSLGSEALRGTGLQSRGRDHRWLPPMGLGAVCGDMATPLLPANTCGDNCGLDLQHNTKPLNHRGKDLHRKQERADSDCFPVLLTTAKHRARCDRIYCLHMVE